MRAGYVKKRGVDDKANRRKLFGLDEQTQQDTQQAVLPLLDTPFGD